MSQMPVVPRDRMNALRSHLAAQEGAVLEPLAAEHGLTLRDAIQCLPDALWRRASGSAFVEVMQEVAGWGPVLVLIHTRDVIFECHGPLPPGDEGRGFYNLRHGSPLRGHLRGDRCGDIFFVRRRFMGRETCSIVLCNHDGEGMFKIFVDRDEQGELREEQVKRFDELSRRLAAATHLSS